MDDTSQKERKKKHSTFLPFSTVLKVRTVTKFKIKKLIDERKSMECFKKFWEFNFRNSGLNQ